MVSLRLDDIQGNILRGYGLPEAVHLFLTVPDPAAGRAFLHATAAEVTSAAPWGDGKPATTTNVAVTYAGLRALGVPGAALAALPEAFRAPMRRRARAVLDDLGPSDPDRWDTPLGTEHSHLLVLLAAQAREPLDERVATVAGRAERLGLGELHRQRAGALPNQREHFGWADGFGQPAVEGAGGSRAGQGVPLEDGTWRDLKPGEFILGYPDEDGQVAAEPLLRNGSFMVYRKLRQDVVRFREALRAEAQCYGRAIGSTLDGEQLDELLAAKIVGRWRDGVALALAPQRPDARSRGLDREQEPAPDNDFRYYDADRDGFTCPRGAHIRRTNPRDAQGWGGKLATRHRIIRRGMPYGRALTDPAGDDEDRGLVFMCMNADIERQFEVVQAQWCNDGNAFGLGDDKDYLLGDNHGTGKITIEGRPPYFARAQPEIVLTRGSEYLLMPGIRALHRLARSTP